MQLVRAVDVDTAFALFLAVDWLWLWASGRLAGVRGRWWRLGTAAALAAAAGVWAEFPAGAWLRAWPAKLAVCLALAAAAYAGRGRARSMVRLLAAFLGTGAAMAGAGLLLGGGRVAGMALVPVAPGVWAGYAGPAPGAAPLALAGAALAVAGGGTLLAAGRAWQRAPAGLVDLEAAWDGRTVRLKALVDTGNHLLEPLSGLPVVVADPAALAGVLPAAVLAAARDPGTGCAVAEQAARSEGAGAEGAGAEGAGTEGAGAEGAGAEGAGAEGAGAEGAGAEGAGAEGAGAGSAGPEGAVAGPAGLPPRWAARCRLVPYRAVGTGGWLLALRPDRLAVAGRPARAYVALAPGPVDPGGRFGALAPPELLAGGRQPYRPQATRAGGEEA